MICHRVAIDVSVCPVDGHILGCQLKPALPYARDRIIGRTTLS